ncbi:MAG: SIMPL domain-containing protein [Peptococcaceae bacterium]|nr:SIMPL domain-containing protein [Peptococcaceae bacterium]
MKDFFKQYFKEWSTVLAAVILGISVIVGTVIVARMVTYVKTFDASQLAVTGTAEQNVTSNEVKWTGQFSVDTNLTDLKTGYAQMDKDKALVTGFLQKNGISSQDVTVSPVVMSETFPSVKYNPQAAQALGKAALSDYTLRQTVVVQSGNVNKITGLTQQVGSMINEGVNFSTQRLEYYYTKLPGLRSQMIAKAVTDAQTRAEKIAAATGVNLGPLVSVNTGVLQLTPVNSTEVSNMGTYDTTTIRKTLTAVVRASFRLAN